MNPPLVNWLASLTVIVVAVAVIVPFKVAVVELL